MVSFPGRHISSVLTCCCQTNSDDVLSDRGKFFMVALALQYGWQPLMTKECIGPDVQKSSIVIFQEVFKFFLSVTMLLMEGGFAKWTDVFANANGKGGPLVSHIVYHRN